MAQFSSFREIIGLWHTLGDFAADLDIPYQTAAGMKLRNSIAARYWPVLVEKAKAREFQGVTLKALAALAHDRGMRRAALRQRTAESRTGAA